MPEKVGRDSARKRSKAIIKVRKTVLLIVNSDNIDIALFVKIKVRKIVLLIVNSDNIDIALQCIVCQDQAFSNSLGGNPIIFSRNWFGGLRNIG